MGFLELFAIAVGLSMDAFAVSVCKGLSAGKVRLKHILCVGLWFGGFQAGMPLLGYFLGSQFEGITTKYDHWIAFVLLCIIGANMIKEARAKTEGLDASFSFKTMFLLAVATSIDALAVGLSLAFLKEAILYPSVIIGVVAFAMTWTGVAFGGRLGRVFGRKVEIAGGLILIGIGVKILLEHLRH
ncbi:MAG TPA: manganese efflux pump MntP family protein [Oscillospiraceae bacterium]|nr:manganese efflux pump MntP family protein [Oscillospiraceae bacterium]